MIVCYSDSRKWIQSLTHLFIPFSVWCSMLHKEKLRYLWQILILITSSLLYICVCYSIPHWNRTALIRIPLFANNRKLIPIHSNKNFKKLKIYKKRWDRHVSHMWDLWGLEMKAPISLQRLSVSLICFPLYASFCISTIHMFLVTKVPSFFQERILICPCL